jgi:hypothetical protein
LWHASVVRKNVGTINARRRTTGQFIVRGLNRSRREVTMFIPGDPPEIFHGLGTHPCANVSFVGMHVGSIARERTGV